MDRTHGSASAAGRQAPPVSLVTVGRREEREVRRVLNQAGVIDVAGMIRALNDAGFGTVACRAEALAGEVA